MEVRLSRQSADVALARLARESAEAARGAYAAVMDAANRQRRLHPSGRWTGLSAEVTPEQYDALIRAVPEWGDPA